MRSAKIRRCWKFPNPLSTPKKSLDYVHGLVIKLLEGGRGLLQAEPSRWEVEDVAIPWQILRGNSPPEEAGWSPRWGHFRACLAAFGFFYLEDNPYGGFRAGKLRYRDRRFKYAAYMSNNNFEMAEFWLRMYVKPE